MESTRSKRRGLIAKSKLIMAIYRATKPSNVNPRSINPSNSSSLDNPIKPKAGPSNSAMASSPVGLIIVNQDQVFAQQKPKVAFVVPDRSINGVDSYGKLENFNGDDEAVDAKAARYISSVQERFRLERVNSERVNIEDLQV